MTGISENPTKVSNVIHKAFVEVDEQGTEAAAATVVQVVAISAIIEYPPTPWFIADHPFMFILLDRRGNDDFMFIGTVATP